MPDPAAKISSPRLSRRRMLQVGGIGMFGLSLPQLLGVRRAAAKEEAGGLAKSCIFIVLSGGPSHIDTLDPKPDAPREIRGAYQSIATCTPGVRLSEMLPRLAAASDQYALIRSLSHRDGVHVSAAHTMLTGGADGSRNDESPFIGSLVSLLLPSTENAPSYVWLHNMKTGTNKVPRYHNGLSRTGYDHAPLRIGHELDNPAGPDFRVRMFDPPEGTTREQLLTRMNLLDELDAARAMEASDALRGFHDVHARARDILTGPSVRLAFDVVREPAGVRERYGLHPLGQYTLMARRLVEAGVRLVTVTGWPGLAPGETEPTITQVWDTHGDRYAGGDSMYGNGPFGMKWSLPRVDQAVSALLQDLAERGLLEETLVVVAGEFGRTPRFEKEGKGRGHWPECYAGLLAGGGIRGGAVYGASDRQGGFVASGRPISHADFAATVFQALGIPPETRYGLDGFSYRVNSGEPLLELFG